MTNTIAISDPTNTDDTVIAIRNIGKMYRIYQRPQDRLKQMLFWRLGRNWGQEFWALRNVSFQVRRGETLGIIGRNGSGKSTLLQIIAGTLAPSEGSVTVKGRIAALLELGSGFNPEFTGRENVFMNGAILGLSHQEIERRLDAILDFAEIGRFIDQPVKFYSSGMSVRLAFAVQANIEPDVLIVDEALAVGDVFFQQKCYRHLEDLRSRGVAVIVVSHGMADIEQYCQQALLLDRGAPVFLGPAVEAVARYYLMEQQDRRAMSSAQLNAVHDPVPNDDQSFLWPDPEALLDISTAPQVSNGAARCVAVAVCNTHGQPQRVFRQGETATFFSAYELLEDTDVPISGLQIYNAKSVMVHGKNSLQYPGTLPGSLPRGTQIYFRQDVRLDLADGEYTFEVGLATIDAHDFADRALFSPPELYARVTRLCHLPNAGRLAVIFRSDADVTQSLHHGIADLPGSHQFSARPPNADKTRSERSPHNVVSA